MRSPRRRTGQLLAPQQPAMRSHAARRRSLTCSKHSPTRSRHRCVSAGAFCYASRQRKLIAGNKRTHRSITVVPYIAFQSITPGATHAPFAIANHRQRAREHTRASLVESGKSTGYLASHRIKRVGAEHLEAGDVLFESKAPV